MCPSGVNLSPTGKDTAFLAKSLMFSTIGSPRWIKENFRDSAILPAGLLTAGQLSKRRPKPDKIDKRKERLCQDFQISQR